MTAELNRSALESRRRVWTALSELFLDTEIDVDDVISSLQGSGYSRADIATIMHSEVAPVVGVNVLSVTGEWAFFDLTPIEERYLAGKARPSTTGRLALKVIRQDWQRVLAALR